MRIIKKGDWYCESRYGGAVLKPATCMMVQFDEGEALPARDILDRLVNEAVEEAEETE